MREFQENISNTQKSKIQLNFNPFVPNAPFLYLLKISDNLTVFWCFQGVEKGYIGNEYVKNTFFLKQFKENLLPWTWYGWKINSHKWRKKTTDINILILMALAFTRQILFMREIYVIFYLTLRIFLFVYSSLKIHKNKKKKMSKD